jgi:hypothetical protein
MGGIELRSRWWCDASDERVIGEEDGAIVVWVRDINGRLLNRTRAKRLMKLGLERHRAFTSAYNGHGPWWNAGASHMNHAVPTRFFSQRSKVKSLKSKGESLISPPAQSPIAP